MNDYEFIIDNKDRVDFFLPFYMFNEINQDGALTVCAKPLSDITPTLICKDSIIDYIKSIAQDGYYVGITKFQIHKILQLNINRIANLTKRGCGNIILAGPKIYHELLSAVVNNKCIIKQSYELKDYEVLITYIGLQFKNYFDCGLVYEEMYDNLIIYELNFENNKSNYYRYVDFSYLF